MHDADMPFTPEAWDAWQNEGKTIQALAFVSLDFQPRGNTVGNLRAITRQPMLRKVSSLSLRVAGALDGKNNLRIIDIYKPVFDPACH